MFHCFLLTNNFFLKTIVAKISDTLTIILLNFKNYVVSFYHFMFHESMKMRAFLQACKIPWSFIFLEKAKKLSIQKKQMGFDCHKITKF